MSRRAWLGALLGLIAHSLSASPARAGGPIDALELQSASTAASDPNVMLVPLVSARFDSRCIPMPFSLNVSRDPIPSPLGAADVSIREARKAVEAAMKTWGAVPTSFAAMELRGTTANRGRPRMDFINEISFTDQAGLAPGTIAATIPRALQTRTVFRAGQDLDGDGDSDVAAGIAQCADVDRDGDIEFPPGAYEAGTIFEADLIFNTASIRFTVAKSDADTQPRSADLQAIATHELGHAQGLAHSVIDQVSDRDGRGSVMFPSVSLADPADELASRTLDADSIAATTRLYPEGSASSGPAALQGGDVAVTRRFGELIGSVRTPDGTPVVGANVFCRDAKTGEITGSTYSGQARARLDGRRQRLMPLLADSVVNGDFRLLLPLGAQQCGVEALDGSPVRLAGANVVNQLAQIGDLLGQTSFAEELFDGQTESALEVAPGRATPLQIVPGSIAVANFTTNLSMAVDGFEMRREPARFLRAQPGRILAVVIPGSRLLQMDDAAKQMLGAGAVLALQTAEFRTRPAIPSLVPRFASASVNRCSRKTPENAMPTLEVDAAPPLRSTENFVAQDGDFSPFYLDDSIGLGREVIDGIRGAAFSDLCLLLRFPMDAGSMDRGPAVGVDGSDAKVQGLSFSSTDGGRSFTPLPSNVQFSLGATAVAR